MVRRASTIEAIKRFAIDTSVGVHCRDNRPPFEHRPYLLYMFGGGFMAEDSSLYTVIAPEWMKSLGLLSGEPRAIGYDERTLYPILIGTLQILGLGQPLFFVWRMPFSTP